MHCTQREDRKRSATLVHLSARVSCDPADAREYVTNLASHVFPPPDLTASVQREVEDKVELLIKPRRPAKERERRSPSFLPSILPKRSFEERLIPITGSIVAP